MIKILDYRMQGVKHNSDSRLFSHQLKWQARQVSSRSGRAIVVKETVATDLAKLLTENPTIKGVVIYASTAYTFIKTYESLGDL